MDNTKELGESRIAPLIVRFAVPSIVGMVVGALYNIVDRIFIGRGVGPLALAGVTVAFGFQLVQIAFAVLVGIGTSARISISLGQKNKEKAEKYLANGFVLNMTISLTIMTLGLIFLDPMLRVFGASDEVLPYAHAFTFVVLLGSPLGTISMGLNSFIRAEGNPKIAMITQLIGPALNIVFCPLFIFGFKWGVAGSALANIVSQTVGSAWVLLYYLSGRSLLKIRRANLRFDSKIIGPIIALGLPTALSDLASSLTMGIMNNQLVRYGGDIAVTAMGIVFAISNLVFLTLIGTSMGIQPIIGYNIGARLYHRVRKVEITAIGAATVFASLVFAGVQLFPGAFVALFAGSDPEVLRIGTYALRRYFMFLPLMGLQVLGSSYFQAAGKPTKSLILGLSRQFIMLIPLLIILPLFWGLDGVWSAQPAADVLAFALTFVLLVKELDVLRRMEQNTVSGQDGQVVKLLG
jgi:putative MATE family efflux protein